MITSLWILALLLYGAGSDGKGVSVKISAGWRGAPYLLEAAEFLAEESPAIYWQYVDRFGESVGPFSKVNGDSCIEKIHRISSEGLSKGLSTVLGVSLGLRQYSAKLQMVKQISLDKLAGEDESCCWVQVDGSGIFKTVRSLEEKLAKYKPKSTGSLETIHDFDHVFPGPVTDQAAPLTTLYASLGTNCFAMFHNWLSSRAKEGEIVYVLRPTLSQACVNDLQDACSQFGVSETVALPGFGVEMALKSTEYSAVDEKDGDSAQDMEEDNLGEVSGFMFDVLIERKPNFQQELLTFRDQLISVSEEDKILKVWQMQNLGVQTSQRITKASNPIALMADISQNFPSLAGSLSRLEVEEDFLKEVESVQSIITSNLNLLLLNGIPIDTTDFDILELLGRIRSEIRAMDQLKMLGFGQDMSLELLRMRNHDRSDSIDTVKYDLFPRGSIFYFNNLETDAMYSGWSSSVDTLLMPYYQGRIVPVAKNLYTAVLITDMSTRHGIELGAIVKAFYDGKVPVRFGLFPLFQSSLNEETSWDDLSVGEQTTRLFLSIKEGFGAKAALNFWASLSGSDSSEVTTKAVERAFMDEWTKSVKTAKSQKSQAMVGITPEVALQNVHSVVDFASELNNQIRDFYLQASQKGFGQFQDSYLWMNGRVVPFDTNNGNSPQFILEQTFSEMQNLQQDIYYGHITDRTANVLKSVLGRSFTATRYNPKIVDSNVRTIAMDPVSLGNSYLDAFEELLYLEDGNYDKPHVVTYWLVVDLGKRTGVDLLKEAMIFLSQYGQNCRVSLLNQRRDSGGSSAVVNWLERLWYSFVLVEDQSPDLLSLAEHVFEQHALVEKLFNLPSTDESVDLVAKDILQIIESINSTVSHEKVSELLADFSTSTGSRLQREAAFSANVLKLPKDEMAVLINGRMIEIPDDQLDIFMANDFVTTKKLALEYQGGNELLKVLSRGQTMHNSKHVSNNLMAVTSVLNKVNVESPFSLEAIRKIEAGLKEFDAIKISAGSLNSPETTFELMVICNPVSKVGQKLSQILGFVEESFSAFINVYLNPPVDLSEMPLKQYYRYALPTLTYTTEYFLASIGPPAAYFSFLPSGQLLTANPDVPKAWLVEAVDAEQDMDNLRMEEVSSDVLFVEYRLENLLLTGSCVDPSAKSRKDSYPRGVQLVLGNEMNAHAVDTLVMSNLGYFQLKALPGLWKLKLANGRSDDLYQLEAVSKLDGDPSQLKSHDSRHVEKQNENVLIQMDNLAGQNIGLKLRKKTGMEDEDVLSESPVGSDDSSIMGRAFSWFGGMGAKLGPKSVATSGCEHEDDPINIFTIASGHMYERLQKIMVLSVLKTTRSCVKFWFIKNYMSPQMKDFLPFFASKYGFDYDLITYKWPSWLTKQTEKQRVIWAYKILFLDVLFPLNVRRVLFVDADQIVRTDLRELYDMNIRGAPLAYTPFCDNNEEMEGFRFWKKGFWKDHLQGKPYHISALYVVDLQSFRTTAAGDKLRIIYENLSKDPNSLANLDQDLPNYAQHMVPIYSLSPEWLWCESWCGNDTKAAAKTIDLCNNPMTKEPKLQAARRIVAEWPALDEEARAFTSIVEGELRKHEFTDFGNSEDENLLLSDSCTLDTDSDELNTIVENDQDVDRIEL